MSPIRIFKSKLAFVGSALLFALIGVGMLAAGVGLIWRALERDNAAFVEQSIGDTASMLGLQTRLEIERLQRVLAELGEERLKPLLNQPVSEVTVISNNNSASPVTAALAEAASVIAAASTTATIDTEPEISEVALWRKEDSGKQAEREFVAVNSRFADTSSEHLARNQGLEAADRARIEPAFHGHVVVVAEPLPAAPANRANGAPVTPKPLALVAVPLGNGEVSEVAVAHVNFEKIQKLFSVDGLVQSALIDRNGLVLAHLDPARLGRKESESGRLLAPLFEHLSDSAGAEGGIFPLKNQAGKTYYGGFRRIPSVGLVVLSGIPVEQSGGTLDWIRAELAVYLLLVFSALFVGRVYVLRRVARGAGEAGAAGPAVSATLPTAAHAPGTEPAGPAPESAPPTPDPVTGFVPKKAAIVALHGSLRGFNQLLEESGPEDVAEALNDYFLSAASIVRGAGGHFECYAGASFGAAWELGGEARDSTAKTAQAVGCALALRAEMARLNESRKLDGKKPLRQGVGMHVGQALIARLGALPDLRETVTGEALACARALDRLGLASGKDLVVSQELVKAVGGVFTGKGLGESKLTADTGLTPYFAVVGFREDATLTEGVLEAGTFGGQDPGAPQADERLTGGETRSEIARPGAAPSRWLVNNGSNIVGPFTAREISRMLFAQELDFDCECWHEETGRSAKLEDAGVFGGSQDADARFWVYDGELVHGPMSEGFIRTAISHGAFAPEASVCEKSTIQGWKKLAQFVAELQPTTDRKPGTDSGGAAA